MVSGKESTVLGWESTFLGMKTTFSGIKSILINSTFGVWEFFGRSLVRPWFLLGL